MNPYVPTATRVAVLNAALEGVDPFGLAPMHKNHSLMPAKIRAGLMKPGEKARLIMAEDLSRGSSDDRTGLDRLTAELVRSIGIEPLSLAWFSYRADSYALIEDDGRGERVCCDLRSPYDSADCLTRVEIAPGIDWYAMGMLHMPDLPETITSAAEGMMLRDIVSHPVLDRHTLRIERLSEEARLGHVGFEVDVRHSAMSVAQLLEMAADQRG